MREVSDKSLQILFSLYEMSETGKAIQRESKLVVAQSWEVGAKEGDY